MALALSVIISTLNNREHLLSCLESVRETMPSSCEIIVVNGPSSDGTTGAIRERDDVDVLVEISERNQNVSRNAGLKEATGDVIAFLDDRCVVKSGWYDAVETTVESGADVVTGPVVGEDSQAEKTPQTIGGRTVTRFSGANVAFGRTVLEALDGFDEYLTVCGERDCAHRVAGLGFDVTWSGEMAVRSSRRADDREVDWGARYRSLAYRLSKNYGLWPTILARLAGCLVRDGLESTRAVVAGEATPTGWFANGRTVLTNTAGGVKDGIRARFGDRTSRRNPNGVSTRQDRAVQVYDWR